jgi:hypothetical protein
MEEITIVCSNCNQAMLPVDLQQVPAEDIKDFVSKAGNKLDDNWYWCSYCDTYEQYSTHERLSPESERLIETLESNLSAW